MSAVLSDLAIVAGVFCFMSGIGLLTLALFDAFDHARQWWAARTYQPVEDDEAAQREAEALAGWRRDV